MLWGEAFGEQNGAKIHPKIDLASKTLPRPPKGHPKRPQEPHKRPKRHPKSTQKAPKSTQKGTQEHQKRHPNNETKDTQKTNKKQPNDIELIRCSRPWPCFGELNRRFPFSAAQVFDQIFGQVFDQGFDQGFWSQKYSVQFYWDGELQCTFLLGRKK